jgi:hypothetical protein
MEDKLYTVAELSKILGVTTGVVYRRIPTTDVNPVWIKGVMYFEKEDAEKLLEYKRRGRPKKII